MAIIADEPAHCREEKLAKWRVNIEEVRALQVVGGELKHMIALATSGHSSGTYMTYLSEVHLVEDNFIGV